MAQLKSVTLRWGALFIFLILGTWAGIFMQRFSATSSLFANFINFNIDIRQIDLTMLRFGFNFAMKVNLGTIIGGFVGVWFSR